MQLPEDFKNYGSTLLLWIVAYVLAYQILRRLIPVPGKIAKNPDQRKRNAEYSYHVFSHLSLFHAVSSLVGSVFVLSRRTFFYEERNQPDSLNLLCFSAAYYLSSTLMGRVYKFHPLSMLCHHLIILAEVFYVFWCGFYGNIIIAGFAIAETSNPFRILKNLSDGHVGGERFGRTSMTIFAAVFLAFRWANQTGALPRPAVLRAGQPDSAHSKNERRGTLWAD